VKKALNWARKRMLEIAPDTVYLQEVVVPHWERGANEKSFFNTGRKKTEMKVCALGGCNKWTTAGECTRG